MDKDPRELVRSYLRDMRMMQIATVRGDQPWICTVYGIEDDNLNLYWLSFPTRRHSQEIADGSKVAIAVPIKFDKPVIGIQAEGEAREVADPDVVKSVLDRYAERYNVGHDFYANYLAGVNKNKLYKFTPRAMVLFDEVTFPVGQGRKEIAL